MLNYGPLLFFLHDGLFAILLHLLLVFRKVLEFLLEGGELTHDFYFEFWIYLVSIGAALDLHHAIYDSLLAQCVSL